MQLFSFLSFEMLWTFVNIYLLNLFHIFGFKTSKCNRLCHLLIAFLNLLDYFIVDQINLLEKWFLIILSFLEEGWETFEQGAMAIEMVVDALLALHIVADQSLLLTILVGAYSWNNKATLTFNDGLCDIKLLEHTITFWIDDDT